MRIILLRKGAADIDLYQGSGNFVWVKLKKLSEEIRPVI